MQTAGRIALVTGGNRGIGYEICRQLAAQGPSGLDEKRLVDGFVTDAHALIVREVEPQAAGDLLRAPRVCPSPVLPWSMPTAFPGYRRTGNTSAAWSEIGRASCRERV